MDIKPLFNEDEEVKKINHEFRKIVGYLTQKSLLFVTLMFAG